MTRELIEAAALAQREFDASTSPEERKGRGHFGTPPAVAEFMAGMSSALPPGTVRILDPGAGVGTLSAAVCQRALREPSPRRLSFELWENDPKLVPWLERTMAHCRDVLRDAGQGVEFTIRVDDFLLGQPRASLFEDGPEASFHLAILNPPYFKLRKGSPQARAMGHVVHGQPNIYALFLAAAADRLRPGGELVAITPRSYFNGPYFKRFRKWFFERLAARQIHSFESRAEAFKDDAVLQENVILHAEKGGVPEDVALTTSLDRDFAGLDRETIAHDRLIDGKGGDHVVRLPTNRHDREIVEAIEGLPGRFRGLGLEISTGPVVAFRATDFLRDERADDTAPLLWMHNVRPFVTRFPPRNGKPAHLLVNEASRKLLVPAGTYVLLKRFTAKEERRRLVAGILSAADSYSAWVGLENHLNYVYRKGSELSRAEAFGLAAFFNSTAIDRYFRAISGSTQVNAAEIRGMPVPEGQRLVAIGEAIERTGTGDQHILEQIVGRALRLPRGLIN